MKKFVPLLQIIRPVNGIIGMIAVFIGALLTHKEMVYTKIILACISCFLIISAGNAINDYVDAEIDSKNRPERPIPKGRITKTQAIIISIILFGIGIGVSIKISSAEFIIATLATMLLLIYNFEFKKRGITGNLIVAYLGGLPFIYGGVAVKACLPTLVPFAFAFMLHLGREILKDIEDAEGDRMAKSESFPIKYGTEAAIRLVILVLAILILSTPVPFIAHLYGIFYLIAVLVCMDLGLGFIIYKLLKNAAFVPKASVLLKFNMLIGLGVLYLGYYS
ncbi:MAG: geranylgeranylglycerol-phosphate geranylgeranyltransferase [bacterium]|nr:geranylgeranylglycerol-phosphate geranylgeranyltransferase [bacterium]